MRPRILAAAVRAAAAIAAVALAGCVDQPDPKVSLDAYRQRLAALDRMEFFQTAYIVDRNGALLAELAPEGYRSWVDLHEIAPTLRHAVVATEDRSFYSNTGVDTSAVARAVIQNAQAGETVSGASTITMQLVRLVAFDANERFEQSLERKVREAHLAAEIAERFTKDEILAAYLNVAYFGHRAYGAEAAAQVYFGRSARQLTPAQSTLLAGLLQAPSRLDPLADLAAARERQRVVLNSMVEAGYLTRAAVETIWSQPLGFVVETENPPRRARHFVDYVLAQLPDLIGPEVATRGGFTVTTTLDLAFSERVARIASGHVAALRPQHDLGDAAVVAVRPGTGEIIAMVGGVDYDEPGAGQVNVTVSARQAGSAFKPITYAAALEAGYTPADVLWDVPLQFGGPAGYQPRNYDGQYRGPVRMRQALASSLNAASVALLADVGLARVHDLATVLGLRLHPDPWSYGLSLTLGGAETRLLDLTGAYAAFAAGGRYTPATGVLAVERTRDGVVLYAHEPRPRQVVSPQTAYQITSMLSDAEARRSAFGTGGPLQTTRPTAVKTGTTDDYRDNLTIGYTPYIAVGVWAGNKDGRAMRNVAGITGAAPVWHDTMEALFGSEELLVELGDGRFPPFDFAPPPGLVRAEVCDLATFAVGGGCRAYSEVFAAGRRVGDPGAAYDLFALRRPGVGDGGGAMCAFPDRSSGRAMLLPPRQAELAQQVRRWAGTRGFDVAPPLCAGVAWQLEPPAPPAIAAAGLATPRDAGAQP